MNSRVFGLRVAGIVFGLIAVAQVVRLLLRADVLVNGHHLPLWPQRAGGGDSWRTVFGCSSFPAVRRAGRQRTSRNSPLMRTVATGNVFVGRGPALPRDAMRRGSGGTAGTCIRDRVPALRSSPREEAHA